MAIATAAACWLSGCRGGSLETACVRIQADVDLLEFPDVRLGESVEKAIATSCVGGAATLDLHVVGHPGFSVEADTVEGVDAMPRVLRVRFRPVGYDSVTASLTLAAAPPASAPPLVVALRASVDPDSDADGYRSVHVGGLDCDDTTPSTFPGAAESANGVDDDCDGLIDEDYVRAEDLALSEVWFGPDGTTWVELVNNSAGALYLDGWILTDGVRELRVAPGSRVAAASRGVLAWSPGALPPYAAALIGHEPPSRGRDWAVTVDDRVVAELPALGARHATSDRTAQVDPIAESHPRYADDRFWCPSIARATDDEGWPGTPGGPNARCDSVDHDGDGYSIVDGDCDDTDPRRHPGRREVLDGVDNACDGSTDRMLAPRDAVAVASGGPFAGFLATLGTVDVGGERHVTLTRSGPTVSRAGRRSGAVTVFLPRDLETLRVVESGATLLLGAGDSDPRAGYGSPRHNRDLDGDGVQDLVLGSTEFGLYVFHGPFEPGVRALSDADGTISLEFGTSVHAPAIEVGDVDGDGVAEAVFATRGRRDHGELHVLWFRDIGDGVELGLDDLRVRSLSRATASVAGKGVLVQDFDDDGYDDVASENDAFGTLEGTVYIVNGSAAGTPSGDFDAQSNTTIGGLDGWSDDYYDAGFSGVATDVDDDGLLDLVLRTGDGTVGVFTGGISHRGALTAPTRGIYGPRYIGCRIEVSDVDNDGQAELLFGLPSGHNTGAIGGVAVMERARLSGPGPIEVSPTADIGVRSTMAGDGFGCDFVATERGGGDGVGLLVGSGLSDFGFEWATGFYDFPP